MLKETNDMRRLMGLNLIKEEEDMMEMENYGDHQERDEYDDRESEVIGVDSDIDKQRLQKEDEDIYEGADDIFEDEDDILQEGEESLPTMKEMKKCVSEGMSKKAVCEKYGGCDQEKLKEMYDSCKSMNEDSEGEETYNYGEDEGADHEEEEHLEDEEKMAPHDRIKAIEDHLEALKNDMGYDEDHEDRDEEGTHFAEGKKYSKLLNTLTESEYRTLKRYTSNGKNFVKGKKYSNILKTLNESEYRKLKKFIR